MGEAWRQGGLVEAEKPADLAGLSSLRLCNLDSPPSSYIALMLLTQTKLGQTSRAFVSFCLPGILSLLILSWLVILHHLKFRDFP